ncbi:MAG: hypothetical protein ABIG03_08220 [Candidatus Eisenbacteria bacterium]
MISAIRRPAPALIACLLLVAGCTKLPPPGAPVTEDELELLVAELSRDAGELRGLRASGSGSATLVGRNVDFTFALAYDNPGWLRADLRPEVGSLSSTLTALVLWEGGCSRAYLPARGLEVRGCLAGPGEMFADLDYAAVSLGRLDARVLTGLENAEISVSEDARFVRGTHRGVELELEVRGSPVRMTGLTLTDDDSVIEFRYGGHGWKPFGWFPETVSTRFTRAGRTVVSASFNYKSATLADGIDRSSFTFDVPPDATIIGWEELGL